MIGVLLTAFCVHMSYHESAIGFGDNADRQAQRVLERKLGIPSLIFLCALWPFAILIAFRGSGIKSMDPVSASIEPKNGPNAE